ncbi:MAG: right-handed parallel beta-helix repeat-containing protein [Spirochaetota bacterium]
MKKELIVFITIASAAAFAADIFVAPTGSDANPGTREKPFAGIVRAQTAARAEKHKNRSEAVTVWLSGGTYRLLEKLVFTAEDAGSENAPVVYRSLAGERAVVSGGMPITGTWKKIAGKPFYEISVPDVASGKWFFNSLYVNGVGKTRARKPNEDQVMLRAKGRAYGEASNKAFVFYPGDIDAQWRNLADADIVLIGSWTPTIHAIASVDTEKGIVKFESTHGRPVDFWEKNFRYYVANVFEALDTPGEWYLDRKSGTLYYYPEATEDMSKAEVIAPKLMTTIMEIVSSDAAKPVAHLEFRDLMFAHTDGDMEKHNGVYRQGHMFLSAAIYAKNMRRSIFSNCEIAHLGEYAMELDTGCQENTIVRCHIWDMGAGGIQIGITDLKTLQMLEQSKKKELIRVQSNIVDNSIVHRLGTIWHGCYGILNRFASYSKITHNEIFDVHWDAIASDARWTYKGEDHSGGHEIAYNYMHYLGLGYHGDAAGYYQFGPLDTWVHHNITHDTVAYPFIHAGFAGYYLDEQSRAAVVENNIAYNIDWSSYFQNRGSNNVFRNNIGAFTRNGFIWRGAILRNGLNHFAASNNIFIASNTTAIGESWEAGPMPPELSKNIYWNINGDANMRFFSRYSLAEFQKLGYEHDSLITDPGCRDPKKFDFTVDTSSAAIKLGFVPFDDEIRKAGVYGDETWRSLAKRFTVRSRLPVEDPNSPSRRPRIDLDFESMPAGTEPADLTIRKEGAATFMVSEEAAFGGRRSLKCIDRKDISKSYNPHFFVAYRNIERGVFRASFDAMISPDEPISYRFEVRGKGSVDETGPRLDCNADGGVLVCDTKVADIRPGTWVHVEIAFTIGSGEFSLLLKYDGGELNKSFPFLHAHFRSVSWAGITAGLIKDGSAYFDNLKMSIE